MNGSFAGKVALITGAAGNLGHAVALKFEEAGANVVVLDRAADRLSEMYPRWMDNQHLLLGGIDLTDQDQVEDAVGKTIGKFGHLDIVINAAGGYRAGDRVHELSDSTWNFMIDLNARTILNMSRAVIPHMINRGAGKIVNVGARPGLQGTTGHAAYAVSKSAVLRLTESMSAELHAKGINVNAVIPGTLDTPQNREAMPDADFSRWVQLNDLAAVILFLASEEANAVHGVSVPVYGAS